MNIKIYYQNIIDELNNDHITKQRRRYLDFHLDQLDKYIDKYPNITEAPTHLELYCNENPDAPECLKYDV